MRSLLLAMIMFATPPAMSYTPEDVLNLCKKAEVLYQRAGDLDISKEERVKAFEEAENLSEIIEKETMRIFDENTQKFKQEMAEITKVPIGYIVDCVKQPRACTPRKFCVAAVDQCSRKAYISDALDRQTLGFHTPLTPDFKLAQRQLRLFPHKRFQYIIGGPYFKWEVVKLYN